MHESSDSFLYGNDHFYDGKDALHGRKDRFCHGNDHFWRKRDRSEEEKDLFWSRIDLLDDQKDFLWEEWIDSVTEMILWATSSVLRTTKWILSVIQRLNEREKGFFSKKNDPFWKKRINYETKKL